MERFYRDVASLQEGKLNQARLMSVPSMLVTGPNLSMSCTKLHEVELKLVEGADITLLRLSINDMQVAYFFVISFAYSTL